MHFTGTKSSPQILPPLEYKKCSARMEATQPMQCITMENTQTKPTLHDETKKRAHDPQTARAKENPKPSHGRPSHRQAPGTNPPIKAPRQSRHRARGLTHRRATKEETTATNHDRAQNQACRLPHDTQITSNPYTTLYTKTCLS